MICFELIIFIFDFFENWFLKLFAVLLGVYFRSNNNNVLPTNFVLHTQTVLYFHNTCTMVG